MPDPGRRSAQCEDECSEEIEGDKEGRDDELLIWDHLTELSTGRFADTALQHHKRLREVAVGRW